MSKSEKLNRASRALLFTQIQAGIAKHVTAPVVLEGKSYAPAALSAAFQSAIQAEADLDAARTVADEKLQAKDTAVAAADALVPPLRKQLEAQYGEDSTVLGDFGLDKPKKVAKSAEVKAQAAQKGRATRASKKAALAAAASPAKPVAPAAPSTQPASPAAGTPATSGKPQP